ncbi:hypothetical protein RR48_02224 [Papilio machaon]|uniref:DHHA2 domain-containing protein n=1 Tax=Papilio machaon TaxID=76193 RepID=A0A0N0PC71_PAPMA|nr:hypothetical protein RR48_02224 [Papilio machaon]
MFLNWQYEKIKCKVCTKDKRVDHKDNIFIPLLDVNREDYSLKTEVAYCLNENNISEDNLVFRKSTVDKLVIARSDVTKLSAAQLLKKDVKIVGDVLVPSFPIPVKEFLNKPGALLAVSEALNNRGCAIALLLGMRLTPSLVRDAAVYSTSLTEKAGKLAKYIQDSNNPTFGLTPEVFDGSDNCEYYNQTNLGLTRKQYIPVLTNFLQNYK